MESTNGTDNSINNVDYEIPVEIEIFRAENNTKVTDLRALVNESLLFYMNTVDFDCLTNQTYEWTIDNARLFIFHNQSKLMYTFHNTGIFSIIALMKANVLASCLYQKELNVNSKRQVLGVQAVELIITNQDGTYHSLTKTEEDFYKKILQYISMHHSEQHDFSHRVDVPNVTVVQHYYFSFIGVMLILIGLVLIFFVVIYKRSDYIVDTYRSFQENLVVTYWNNNERPVNTVATISVEQPPCELQMMTHREICDTLDIDYNLVKDLDPNNADRRSTTSL